MFCCVSIITLDRDFRVIEMRTKTFDIYYFMRAKINFFEKTFKFS